MNKFDGLFRAGIFFSLLFIILHFSSACTYEKRPPIAPNMACDTLMPTYVNEIKPIIDVNCSYPGCHAAGYEAGDFTNYASMKSRLDGGQFETRVIIIKDMPPPYASGPKELTQEEFDLLQCWLQNGYPEQ